MDKIIVRHTCIAVFLSILFSCEPHHGPKDFDTPISNAPDTILLNTSVGYTLNQLTGNRINPITNPSGDSVKTGTPVAALTKIIQPDSIQKPFAIPARQPKSIYTNNNITRVAENVTAIPIDLSGPVSRIDTLTSEQKPAERINSPLPHKAPSQTADTTFISYPPPHQILASPPRMKDAAKYNIQYLDVDQGMNSSYVMCTLQDARGNLWFGTWGAGASCYNGKHFQHFTEKEGVSNNFVNCMLEDKNKNLWFGTNGGGITQYDGNNFKHYTIKEGLIHNRVFCLLEDTNGNIWIGTGGGLSRFDGKGFTNFTVKDGLNHNDIRCILEDKNGALWIGTAHKGLSRFDGNTFSTFRQNDLLIDSLILCLFQDTKGNIWMSGSNGGISQFDGRYLRHYAGKEGLTNKLVRNIMEDKSGNIWFATAGDGVIRYDGMFFTKFTETQGLSSNTVFSLLEDDSGNIWCGTQGGGVSFISRTNFQHFTEKDGLSNRKVRNILEDKKGNIWFAVEGGGVSRFDGYTFLNLTKEEGFPDNNVRCMQEDKKGNLWFGTYGHGAICYDGKSYKTYGKKEGLSDDIVLSMEEDKKGNLWFGTAFGGVTCYDGKGYTHYTTAEGMSNNTIWAIHEDHSGKLWFGTDGGGVSCYDGKTFIHYTEKEGLSNNKVRCILEDKNGDLWFGTEGAGVSRFNGSYFINYTEKQGLSYNIVWNLQQDKNSNIWIGTENGLNLLRLDPSQNKTQEIITFENTDGLQAKDFGPNSALIDSKNKAWWGTGKTLTMLDLNQFSIPASPPTVTLTQLDINEQFYDFHTMQDSIDADIKYATVLPFSTIPVALKLPYDKNHLHFQFNAIDWAAPHKIKYTYQLQGLSNDWSNTSEDAYADYRNLSPGTYTLNVAATGIAQKWSEPFSYSFTIRPPWWQTWWAYTLFILTFLAALRFFSKWRERNLRLENETLETKVIQRTNELKETLEHLKSTQTQLVYSAKMASLGELTAGIAHEIQNPLNFVNNFSEVNKELLVEMKTELENGNTSAAQIIASDVIENEEKINLHGKRADSIVKGMLQHSRSSTGIKEPTDINALADENLRLAFHGMRAKDKTVAVTMKTDFDPSIGMINIVPQDIGRVILNLITNAFYAVSNMSPQPPKGGENFIPTVSIKTRKLLPPLGGQGGKQDPMVEISVRDNGPGIPASVLDKIFQPFFTTKPAGQGTGLGLSLSYDIIKAHGGELIVNTKEGEGSDFIIQIPCKSM